MFKLWTLTKRFITKRKGYVNKREETKPMKNGLILADKLRQKSKSFFEDAKEIEKTIKSYEDEIKVLKTENEALKNQLKK